MKKKLIIGLFIILLFSNILFVSAQDIDRIYVLNLNYKKQTNAELLNLINSYVTQGYPVNYGEPKNGYKINIISHANKTLASIKFSIPTGAVLMPGVTNIEAKGTPDNLNFTIYAPYYQNAARMDVYDYRNSKVLEVPVQDFFNLGERKTIEGKLGVVYDSKTGYIFYLKSGNDIYKLESSQALPVSWDANDVIVQGRILENNIIVESMSLKPADTSTQSQVNKNNLTWISVIIYGALITVILISLLLYRIIRRGSTNNLRLYIIDNLKKGFSKEQIRKALIKANYSSKEIVEAFKGMR